VTHQRREVLRAVVETDSHPDAHTVLNRVREEHDLIGRLHASGERARFDGNSRPHHHFICTECGRIVDFESGELDGMALPDRVVELGTPTSRQLQVFGVCRNCERRKEKRDG